MPTFPNWNGQVKVPLRFYPEHRMTSWNRYPCKTLFADCPWALNTSMAALPPFQFWTPTTSATITSWRIYDMLIGAEQGNITADAGLITHEQFNGIDYWIYNGAPLSVPVPSTDHNNALYAVISFSDGSTYYSELFRATCEANVDSGDFDFDPTTEGLIGWSTGSSANDADATYNDSLGAPVGLVTFEGMVVINLLDNKVYTFIAGSWNAGAVPTAGDYRLVKSTGLWIGYNIVLPWPDGWQDMPDPPFTVAGGYICATGPNPDGLGLFYNDIDFGLDLVTFTIEVVQVGLGSLHIVLGTVDLGNISGSGTYSFPGVTPGETGALEITPSTSPAWSGCIVSISISIPTMFCNHVLEWTNCGNVGGIYYEDGFVNRMILPVETEIIRPTPIINTENTENGRKDQLQDFFRKEVEWKLPMGLVPWHIADALSELGAHDTIRLLQKFAFGTDEIKRVRVVQSWPEGGDDCLTQVDIFFQVEEETVTSSCCDVFDPPCDPELDPGTITSEDCYLGDCELGYVFTADIPAGYRGELLVSTDAGVTWVTTDLDLTAAEWLANTIPVDPVPGYYAILVYFADCEVGLTPSVIWGCSVATIATVIDLSVPDVMTITVTATVEFPGFTFSGFEWTINGAPPQFQAAIIGEDVELGTFSDTEEVCITAVNSENISCNLFVGCFNVP